MSGAPGNPGRSHAMVAMTVDATVCIGAGHCEMTHPDVFRVDDDTAVAAVIGDGSLEHAAALEIIDRCPSGAISAAPGPSASP